MEEGEEDRACGLEAEITFRDKVKVQSLQNGNSGHLGLRVSRKLAKEMLSYTSFYIS